MLFLFCIQNERPHSCAASRLRLYLLQHPVPTLFGFQLLVQGRLAVVEQEVFVVLEIPLTAVFGDERMGGGREGQFGDEDHHLLTLGECLLHKVEGRFQRGAGRLLGGVPGVKPAKVLVIGGGVVGTAAARVAAGMGADVTICDISLPRLAYLADVMPANVHTLMSNRYNLSEEVRTADLVIGSVLIPGASAPKLVTAEMVRTMKRGAVIVDVAIDQGGCCETSHPTTHENPTYYVDGVLHYAVANIPGAVPCTSTAALTNATLPYAVQLADKGWKRACRESMELYRGLNVVEGKVTYRGVAEAWDLPYEPVGL